MGFQNTELDNCYHFKSLIFYLDHLDQESVVLLYLPALVAGPSQLNCKLHLLIRNTKTDVVPLNCLENKEENKTTIL